MKETKNYFVHFIIAKCQLKNANLQ